MRSPVVNDAQALTLFAGQLIERLERAQHEIEVAREWPADEPLLQSVVPFDRSETAAESGWLYTARRRLERQLQRCSVVLESALALPEFRAQRASRIDSLLQGWVDALQEIDAGIVHELGAAHPVLEMLFPHRNFEKLRRGTAQTNAYRVEFERRRGSTYIRRLASEPEYASLPGLLQRADDAYAPVKALLDAPTPDEAQLESLRDAIAQETAALELVVQQARLLADAAVVTYPALAPLLALEMKRRRSKPDTRAEHVESAPE